MFLRTVLILLCCCTFILNDALALRSISLSAQNKPHKNNKEVVIPEFDGLSNLEAGDAYFQRGYYEHAVKKYMLALDESSGLLKEPYSSIGGVGKKIGKLAFSAVMGTFAVPFVGPLGYKQFNSGKDKDLSDNTVDETLVINTPLYIFKKLSSSYLRIGDLERSKKYIQDGLKYSKKIRENADGLLDGTLSQNYKNNPRDIINLEAILYEIDFLSKNASISSLIGNYADSLNDIKFLNKKIKKLKISYEGKEVIKYKSALVIARIVNEMGDYDQALALYNYVVDKLEEKEGKVSFSFSEDSKYSFSVLVLDDLIEAYRGQAYTYQKLGNVRKAIESANSALKFFDSDEISNSFSSEYVESLMGRVRLQKSSFYVYLRQFDLAKEQLEYVLQRNEKNALLKAEAWLLLSKISQKTGNLETAYNSSESSYQIAKSINDLKIQKESLLLMAASSFKHDYVKALEDVDAAERIAAEMGVVFPEINLMKARIYAHKGDHDKLSKTFKSIKNYLEEIEDPLLKQNYYHLYATHLSNLDKKESAIQNYEVAIDLLEKFRSEIGVDSFKSTFFEDKAILYNQLIDILIDLGQVETAFKFLERSKSRSLVDMVAQRNLNTNSNNKKLYSELKKYENLIASNLNKFEKISYQKTGQRNIKEQLSEKHREVEEKYRSIQLKIKENDSLFASIALGEPRDFKAISKSVPLDTLLVEYYLGEKENGAFLITTGGISFKPLAKNLASKVEKVVKDELISPVERYKRLGNLLLKPLSDKILEKKRIGIIPSGVMANISFIALDFMGKPLIDKKIVFTSPSSTIFDIVTQRKKVKNSNLLIYSDPHFDNDMLKLPFAQKEGRMLSKIYKESFLNEKEGATESSLKNNGNSYNIYHFATHGYFNSDNPMLSYISLRGDYAEDGKLFASEIMDLDFSSDLVVISTCKSGQVKVLGGDEILGINRAFLVAGTRTILSTLWEIDDSATYFMMNNFYKEYARSKDKTEAFRSSILSLKKKYPEYNYWGAFQMVGAIN